MAALYSFPNKASFDGWFDDYKVSGLAEMRHGLLDGQVTSYYSMAGEDVDYDALTHYVVANKKFASAEAKEDFQTNYGSKIKDIVAQTSGCIIKSWPVHPGTTRRVSSRRRGRHSAHHFNRFSERGEETSFPRHPKRKRHERRPRAHVGRTVV